jgi:signal transduction histidine kinase
MSTIAAFLGSVVATTREIELRTATEQQLQELTQHLERRVQDRTRQMRMLNAQTLRAEEHERRRIAEGLHDDVQQLLAASHYGLQSLVEEPGEIAPPDLAEVAGWVEQALSATRSFVFDLSPTVLYEEGLGRALEHLADQMSQRHNLTVTVLAGEPVDPISQGIRVFLYSATRELLFNIVKHAGVDIAQVELSRQGESVQVIVRDHGRGMDLEAPRQSSGVGLASLRERVEYLNGELSIESSVGNGTSVTLVLPLSERQEGRRDDQGDHRR